MQCVSCKADNRAVARYCKKCGTAIKAATAVTPKGPDVDAGFSAVAGFDEVKKSLQKEIVAFRNMKSAGVKYDLKNLSTVLIGNSGCGKSKMADTLARVFFINGITTKPSPYVVTAVGFADFVKNLNVNLDSAKGGILFVDNAHQLVPSGYEPGQTIPIDRLYAEIEKRDGDPIVVMAARPEGFRDYLNANQDVNNRFSFKFYLPDMNVDQMMELANWFIAEKKFTIQPEALSKLHKRMLFLYRNQQDPDQLMKLGKNGFMVNKEMNNIFSNHFTSPRFSENPTTIIEEDITGELFEMKTTQEILAELDDFIGMDGVKTFLKKMVELVQIQQKDSLASGKQEVMGAHLVLTGNPGTGKTTLARKLGEVMASAGILTTGHVVDTDRSKLVGKYIGETPLLVQQAIDEAQGGILLIDEAYTLKQDENDKYGQEAIDTLLKRMEDDRGKFVVVAAGYPKEMMNFINANPGMKSRMKDNFFNLPDYTPDQLLSIMKLFVKKGGFTLSPEAEKKLLDLFTEKYKKRGKDFGNGRDVRNVYESMKIARAERLASAPEQDYSFQFIATDVPGENADLSTEGVSRLLEELNALTGLDEVKKEIYDLVDFLEAERMRAEAGGKKNDINLHCVFLGSPGTGKTTVAKMMARIFKGLGILPKDEVVEVTDKDMVAGFVGQTGPQTNKVIDSAMGGVLFIDEAYTLAKSGGSGQNSFNSEAVDTLLKRMEDDRGKFIVIAAGYTNLMQDFLDANPGLDSRFTRKINFADYNVEDLHTIMMSMFRKAGLTVSPEAETRIRKHIEHIHRTRDKRFANARTVRNEFEKIVQQQSKRIVDQKRKGNVADPVSILPEDIIVRGESAGQLSVEQLMKNLNELTGLGSVKEKILGLVDFLEAEQMRTANGAKSKSLNLHFVFKGSPGTGKTTVARMLGQIFQQLGLLSTGQVIEVTDKDLVAPYLGQTSPLTNKVIDSAIGGVLFIDEAYTLSGKQNGSGQEAIDTLLKRMEDDRGKFIVIAAGYSDQMEKFLDSNPGLDSRFTQKITFEDYQPAELMKIMTSMIQSDRLKLDPAAENKLFKHLEQLYQQKDSRFANARTVRNEFEEILQRQSKRLVAAKRNNEIVDPGLIVSMDIPGSEGKSALTVEEVLSELNRLTGLESVKKEVRALMDFIEIEQMRSAAGGNKTAINLHFLFKGRPGTGKTTVARILANLFKQMGLLSKGQLVEVDRKNLVGQYIGHTARQTSDVIDSALGGILFVDEAYTLMPEGSGNDFGKEAIDTLLKRMEDDKGKFIVIAAGYTDAMDRFVSANEGLASRFTKEIFFEDYTPPELMAIFEGMVRNKKLSVPDEDLAAVRQHFENIYQNRDSQFANGRTVRNIFESSLQKQAGRLNAWKQAGRSLSDEINILRKEDILDI